MHECDNAMLAMYADVLLSQQLCFTVENQYTVVTLASCPSAQLKQDM